MGSKNMETPSWRKPAGMLGILAYVIAWAIGIASLSNIVGNWHVLIQAVFYLIAGIIWILPLRPVLKWMEIGRFR